MNDFQGNAAFKGRQWNKAANYYTEAIKLNGTNATYYCNRAAAYLELGWYVTPFISISCFHILLGMFWLHLLPEFNPCSFQQAEDDCSKAILLDKKVTIRFIHGYIGKKVQHKSSQTTHTQKYLQRQKPKESITKKRLQILLVEQNRTPNILSRTSLSLSNYYYYYY